MSSAGEAVIAVAPCPTVVAALPGEPTYWAWPLYTAFTVSCPSGRAEVVHVAVAVAAVGLSASGRAEQPAIGASLTKKLTEPVPSVGETVAVAVAD